MKYKILQVFFVFVTIPFLIIAQSNSNSFEYIDSLAEVYFPKQNPGAVVLIGQSGKILFHKAYGMADLELNVSMEKDMVFSIASNTKQFTALAIMKLVEEGNLSLDDSLGKYFSNLPEYKKHISIHQLLSHTSGIMNLMAKQFWYSDNNFWRKDFTPDSLINLTIKDSLLFSPGEEFHYGNTSYYFLGRIIELVSGKSYSMFIQDNFINPLGLKNTYVGRYQEILKNRAKGYKRVDKDFMNADYMSYSQAYSAGEIRANAEDFFKWYNSVFDYKIVSRETLSKAHSPVKLTDGRDSGYGYGYFITPIANISTFNHGGMMPGYFVNSLFVPENELCIIVLSNWEYSPAIKLGFEIASLLINEQNQLGAPQFTETKILGEYLANGDILKVIKESDSLFIQYSNGNKERIFKGGGNQYFFGEVAPGVIIFERENNSKLVMKIKWYFTSFKEFTKMK